MNESECAGPHCRSYYSSAALVFAILLGCTQSVMIQILQKSMVNNNYIHSKPKLGPPLGIKHESKYCRYDDEIYLSFYETFIVL